MFVDNLDVYSQQDGSNQMFQDKSRVEEIMNNKLSTLSTEVDVVCDDLDENLEDLVNELDGMFKELMSSPFDDLIADAVSQRGCVYVDQYQPKAN